jgi:TonB family protein
MINKTLTEHLRFSPFFLIFLLLLAFNFEASSNSYNSLSVDFGKVQFPGCFENSDVNTDDYSSDKFGTSTKTSTKDENKELRKNLNTLGKNHAKILDLIKTEDHLEILELVNNSIDVIDSSKIFDLDFLTRFKNNEKAAMSFEGLNIDGLTAGQYAASVIPFLGYESAVKTGMDLKGQRELLDLSFKYSRWIFLNRGCSHYLKNYLNKEEASEGRIRINARSVCRLVNPVEASVAGKLFLMDYEMSNFNDALLIGSLSLTDLTYRRLNRNKNRISDQISRLNILIRLADLSERTQNFCFAYKGYERSVSLAKLINLKPEIIKSWEDGMLRTSSFQGNKEDSWSPRYGNLTNSSSGGYVPIFQVPPVYPRRALEREIEGCVMLQFTVTKAGSTRDPEVLWSQPSGIFDKQAMRSALKYKYKPQIRDGQAVEVPRVKTIVVFKIESPGKDMYYTPPGCD